MSFLTPTPRNKLLWGAGLIALFAGLFLLLSPFFSLEYVESQRASYLQYYESNPLTVIVLFITLSALCTGAALPTTGIFALLGGALFGFSVGLMAVAIAGTIGSTIVLLWSRYLFRDWLQSRFQKQFAVINRGIDEEGGYYLFSIRLTMIIPFFLVNLLCGLTNIKLSTYVISTFLSQTIVVALWTYAGARLASLESSADILNLKTLVVMALVGIAPLLCHRIFIWLRRRGTLKSTRSRI